GAERVVGRAGDGVSRHRRGTRAGRVGRDGVARGECIGADSGDAGDHDGHQARGAALANEPGHVVSPLRLKDTSVSSRGEIDSTLPRSSSGAATAAAPRTAACSRHADSTSKGPIRYPAAMITSSARPTYQM